MVLAQNLTLYRKRRAQHRIRFLQVPSLSHAIADKVERIGHIRVFLRKKLLPHRQGFPFQGFRLFLLPIGGSGPGNIVECCRHPCMVRAELSTTNLQNSPRRFFGFRPLAFITQNQNQGAKRICRLQAVLSEQSLSGPQPFSSQCFRLGEFPIL